MKETCYYQKEEKLLIEKYRKMESDEKEESWDM